MIEKERKVPRSILKLEALIHRLPQGHPKNSLIMEELAKRKAGFSGEKSLEYYFSFFEGQEVSIFHDLRLKDESRYFQIDTLFLTKHYALIIEVKNLAGTLYFDPVFHQLIRTIDGKETAFPDPLIQVNRQEQQLKNWLLKNKLPFLPIESFIVITNPQSIIRTSPHNQNLNKKIIRSENLLTKVSHIQESRKNRLMDEKEWKRLIRLLKKQHVDLNEDLLERYKIRKDEIIRGAICSKCRLILKWQTGSWFCGKCREYSKGDHIQALKDYALLISPQISNKELRDYLFIASPSAAKRLLIGMNMPFSGVNKKRVYYLNFEEF